MTVRFEKMKIVYWSFWPILALFVFGGYFLKPEEGTQDHLRVIPAQTDAVILIHPMAFFVAYEKLLEENPVALKDLYMMASKDEGMDVNLGINPLKKVGVAHYLQEKETEGFVMVVSLTNFKAFIEKVNRRDNKPPSVSYKDGEFLVLDKDDQIFVKKGSIGLLYHIQQGLATEGAAQTLYDDFFSGQESLVDVEPTFAEAVEDDDQISYWSLNAFKATESMNPQLALINELFNRKHIKFNIDKAGFLTQASLELIQEDAIIVREENDVSLKGNECFRFAASVNPNEFSHLLDIVLTPDKHYLIDQWTGGISASVDGFKDIQLKKLHLTPTQDPLYPFKYDTVGVLSTGFSNFVSSFEGQFKYPYFTVACEIDNIAALKEKIATDTSISQVGNYYSYIMEDLFIATEVSEGLLKTKTALEPQRVYFYFVDQSIVFCPELPEKDFTPEYATFYMKFSFPQFVNSYTQSGSGGLAGFRMDQIVVEQMGLFGLGAFELKFKGIDNGKILLDGLFNLENTENHFVGFPLLINQIGSLASIPFL